MVASLLQRFQPLGVMAVDMQDGFLGFVIYRSDGCGMFAIGSIGTSLAVASPNTKARVSFWCGAKRRSKNGIFFQLIDIS